MYNYPVLWQQSYFSIRPLDRAENDEHVLYENGAINHELHDVHLHYDETKESLEDYLKTLYVLK